MADCRIELLGNAEAKAAAKSVDMIASFADLNIFRALLHRPKTAKALSDLLVALLFGGENGWRFAVAATGVAALLFAGVFHRQVRNTPKGTPAFT